MKHLKDRRTWALLEAYAKKMPLKSSNSNSFQLAAGCIQLDYSAQTIKPEGLQLLIELAVECKMKEKISMLLEGKPVNTRQKIPALHTALRRMNHKSLFVNNEDVIPQIAEVQQQMATISHRIRSGQWLGYSGKPLKSIVNIGIGGSDIGAKMCVSSLAGFTSTDLDYHFISDTDPKEFSNTTNELDPETTLFIIASKSFTTVETVYNTQKAIDWIGQGNSSNHFIAVTAHPNKAKQRGFIHIVPIWEWVGGRYSLCSAINLITCIAIGYDLFMELLAGANQMDQHFEQSQLHENMPVILALLGIWNINFLNIPNLLMMICADQLKLLVPYIQQLDMESNGKSIDHQGVVVDYATGPLVLGGITDQIRHGYYQLLMQGTHKFTADFISTQEFDRDLVHSFCASTIQALSGNHLGSNKLKGGMPINHIKLSSCTPFNLGSLIALYEHKIYAQSVIWNINPFDQPGVEFGKGLI